MRDLISIDVNKSIDIVKRWFEDSYQDTLILDELGKHPDIQFEYLKNFIKKNENLI